MGILTQCIDITLQLLAFLSRILSPCEMVVIFSNIDGFKKAWKKNLKL